MKQIQISKVSHHSKDGATSVVDLDIASLNADKNNRITKINLCTNTLKKIEIYQTETFKVMKAQENHFQIATTVTDHNLLIEKIFAKNLRTEKIHENNQKTDIVDQIVKITNIAMVTQDQTQIEVNTRSIIGLVFNQIR